MTDNLNQGAKTTILTSVWNIAKNLHIRLRTFSPNYY